MSTIRRALSSAAGYSLRNAKNFMKPAKEIVNVAIKEGAMIVVEGEPTDKVVESIAYLLSMGAGLKKRAFQLQGAIGGAVVTYLLLNKPKKEKSE